MQLDQSKAVNVFAEYVSHYDTTNGKIALKIEHTYRVAGLCGQIAESLNLPKPDVDLAWLIGLLHDIGRFEQARIYGTFIDAKSVDHGHLSVHILWDEGKLREFADDLTVEEQEILRQAIWYHSVYRLPEELDERALMFCRILRDADKIDILKVNVDYPMEEIYNTTTKELKNSVVSDRVLESLKEHHAVPHALKQSTVDFLVGHLSLTYELVYPFSRRQVKEQGYLDRLLNFESDNPVTRRQFQEIRKEFADFQA